MTVDLEAVRKLEEQLRADDKLVRAIGGPAPSEWFWRNSLVGIADTLRDLRAEIERYKAFAKEVGCALGVEDEPLADIEREAWGRAGTIVGLRTELESSRATIAKLQHVATGIEQQRHDNAKHKIQMQMVVDAAEVVCGPDLTGTERMDLVFDTLMPAIDSYRAARGKT